MKARVLVIAGAVSVMALGCGDSSSDGDQAAQGGIGGNSAVGGAGPTAGGSVAAGGSGASAGVPGVVPTAFATPVPTPGIDCRVDTTIKNCVSIAGTFAGVTVDTACSLEGAVAALAGGDTWIFGCEQEELGWDLRVELPMRRTGIFTESTLGSESTPKFNVIVVETKGSPSPGASAQDPHFSRAEIAGAATRLPNENLLVLGTFHAVWSTPEALCNPREGEQCAAAELNGTFRAEQVFGTCFEGTDCMSGRCETNGKTCFKNL